MIERRVEVWDDRDSSHPVVLYDDVRVPVTNPLVAQGAGFAEEDEDVAVRP